MFARRSQRLSFAAPVVRGACRDARRWASAVSFRFVHRDIAIECDFHNTTTMDAFMTRSFSLLTRFRAPFFRKTMLAAAIVATSSGIAAVDARAGNADLDTSYAFGGVFLRELSAYGGRGTAGALQPDGKLLLGGWVQDAYGGTDFGIARHLNDSVPDYVFGDGTGKLVYDIVYSQNEVTDMAYTSAGIYAAGFSYIGANPVMTLTRLTHAGALDTSFASGGKLTVQVGTWSMAQGIAVQPDGKILLVGQSFDAVTKNDFAVVRVNTNGTLDSSFGLSGKVRIALSSNDNDLAHSVAVTPDGKIYVAGESRNGSVFSTPVIRLNLYGDLDPGFGSGGIVYLSRTGYNLYGRAVALDLEGKVIVGSNALQAAPYLYGVNVTRLNTDGTLDTAYNGNGHFYTPIAPNGLYDLNAMEVTPLGKTMLAGQLSISSSGTTTAFTARIGEGGFLDPSYNNGVGYKFGDIGSSYASPTSAEFLALAPDGKFYVGGYSQARYFAMRYQGDALDVTPDQAVFAPYDDVARSTQQTSQLIYISGLTLGARVPISVSNGSYIRNGAPATTVPGYVANGDWIKLVHTSSPNYGSTVVTTLTVGGLSPANNRGTILGTQMVASFGSTTLPFPSKGGGGEPL